MFDETMLIKADILSSQYDKIKLFLKDGRVLVGVSLGIQPSRDNKTGEELEENCIAIELTDGLYEELKNDEIISVEGVIDA